MALASLRDRSGQDWFLAPEPPEGVKGNMHYGFLVSGQAVDTALQKLYGDEEHDLGNMHYRFWMACKLTAKSSRPLYLGVRRDIKIEKIPGHPLNGLVFGIASNQSRNTRILPREDEIARLKEILLTDAEPEWFQVV
ncbi:hypothetical protein SCHPADRAFT_911421 [Schizopora paradoxa]|uniref:Uncharacterized protein n=1 Tax=Schizopora paradoxa TaxID=27342 RepID=A0A0H2QZI7_9AGAM|nr:hypothetical protein SCHPADRAFT_911421 [Schizopora paradoxa]